MVELKSPYKTQHLLKGSNSSETKMLYLLAQWHIIVKLETTPRQKILKSKVRGRGQTKPKYYCQSDTEKEAELGLEL